ncbi:MAG: NADH-quinone oxidoreductase subunit A [Candidatus Binatia bacterium]|jgi:NADH-quinone oxidoreductase subunit A
MDYQMSQYIGVAVLALAATTFAFGAIGASIIVGRMSNRHRKLSPKEAIKDIAYECGMLPQGDGNSRLSVKFYLVALLFVLFDIEAVFLYPWAVVYKDMLAQGMTVVFYSMLSFLGVLFVGWIYAVKKAAFEWKD